MATVSDLCKLSRPSDLLSTLHCVFVTEGMWLFAALVPFFIFFYLALVLVMDGIYGMEYTDAKISRTEQKTNKRF